MASPASDPLTSASGVTDGRGGVRLATRLSALPHDALAELAAQLAAGSAAALRAAEAVLAAHKPVPQWAVEGVLLSRDLVPHLLAPLESEDGAAAAVCSAWADGWKATEDSRRRLRAVPFDLPQELLEANGRLEMLVVPGDEERLIVNKGQTTRVFDRSMRDAGAMSWLSQALELTHGIVTIADEQSVFFTAGGKLSRFSLDGGQLAKFRTRDHNIFVEDADEDGFEPKHLVYPVLAPGGLIFVLAYVDSYEAYEQDEILALDAESLQLRFRFGLGLLNNSQAMAVVGDELFVCDQDSDRLQVFSLAGEHRRSLVGEWKKPQQLVFVKDRLYLVEDSPLVGDGPGESGRVIWVLSPQGETLNTFTLPAAGHSIVSLHVFDGNLLATYKNNRSHLVVGVLALRGL